ncbi:L,D-transpeptidase family protein [Hoeflea sp.]|uniref:L,D-transpeptidase family protein n=1 Tax=Hoeflea sp. TaxID=1940281 RepID=UPI003B520477
MVLVTTDGRLMQDIPEAGSVRVVVDNQGRRLLIDRWDMVIGFEMPLWQYRQQQGLASPGTERSRRFDRDRAGWDDPLLEDDPLWEDDFGGDAFPAAPPPPRNRDWRRDRDRFANAEPEATIERRDLNPMTGTVPGRDDGSSIIRLPRENSQQPPVAEPAQPAKPAATPEAPKAPKLSKAQVAALQVYLDRNGFSPGVIDGRMGSNVRKALDAWREASGETIDPADTDMIIGRLAAMGGLAFTTYTITAEDAAGPFIASVPTDYAEKARLDRLSFTSTREMLAERFHMDEDYLQELNPEVDFSRPGVEIKVVDTGPRKKGEVSRIVADKGRKQIRAYGKDGRLVVAYPATIGSSSTPSPSGEVTIERIARNPGYTYNPKINFKQGDNDKILQVPPGPNGPVGSIWIALSKPTYGIHGTPEPSKIGKTSSNGCVRLTNWDAEELAGMVAPGVTVSFIE